MFDSVRLLFLMLRVFFGIGEIARVAEKVDAGDLKSPAKRRGSSTLPARTITRRLKTLQPPVPKLQVSAKPRVKVVPAPKKPKPAPTTDQAVSNVFRHADDAFEEMGRVFESMNRSLDTVNTDLRGMNRSLDSASAVLKGIIMVGVAVASAAITFLLLTLFN